MATELQSGTGVQRRCGAKTRPWQGLGCSDYRIAREYIRYHVVHVVQGGVHGVHGVHHVHPTLPWVHRGLQSAVLYVRGVTSFVGRTGIVREAQELLISPGTGPGACLWIIPVRDNAQE